MSHICLHSSYYNNIPFIKVTYYTPINGKYKWVLKKETEINTQTRLQGNLRKRMNSREWKTENREKRWEIKGGGIHGLPFVICLNRFLGLHGLGDFFSHLHLGSNWCLELLRQLRVHPPLLFHGRLPLPQLALSRLQRRVELVTKVFFLRQRLVQAVDRTEQLGGAPKLSRKNRNRPSYSITMIQCTRSLQGTCCILSYCSL